MAGEPPPFPTARCVALPEPQLDSAAPRSPYDHFRHGLLEKNVAVKVYAKLPGWFKVPTPLGSYNPDWAVLVDSGDGERLYLVVETKGTTHTAELRPAEQDKIKCGRAHFAALASGSSPARYEVATSLAELLARVDTAGSQPPSRQAD